MTAEEFDALLTAIREGDPDAAYGTDPPATEADVRRAEEVLGVKLPAEYRAFLCRYGGGDFPYGNVFSVADSSQWYIVSRNRDIEFPHDEFVAISDNEMGDYYGFKVSDARCESVVSLLEHETESVIAAEHDALYGFLAYALLGAE